MSPLAGRRLVAALCGAAAVGVAYLVVAMPGMDHSGMHDSDTTVRGAYAELRELTVDEFADAVDDRGAVVINVQVPDEGAIAGTDATIAYDEVIGDAAELPADHNTPLLLYCGSGRMSRIAGDAVVAAGYRNVAHLNGGMDAWSTQSGRTLDRDRPDA